ncbi:MAG: ABC transporter permease [Microbacterium sp.]
MTTTTAATTSRRAQPAIRTNVLAPLIGLILVLALAAVTTPGFYTLDVARLVLFQIGIIGIAALGQTFVLLLGGIDLSISAVGSLTSVILALYTAGASERVGMGVLFAVLAGIAVGLANAALVVLRNVPPFVATFASFVLVQGIIIVWTGGAPSGRIPEALFWLGRGRILGLPVVLVLFAVLAVAALLVLERTTAGRRIYATGLNPRAARMSGIRVGGVLVAGYVLASLSGVLVGLVNAGFIGYVDAALVRNLDLNSIAAAIIGGVALTGGKGRIGQVVVGVALLAVLLTWLIQLGAGGGTQLVVSGIVILLAVWLQSHPMPFRRRASAVATAEETQEKKS